MSHAVNTRHSSYLGVYTNGPEYLWAFYLQLTFSKKAWTYTYSTASSITYVNIDDMLIFEISIFKRSIFRQHERCFNDVANVMSLKAKKLIIGFDTIPFVGHDIDSRGINMSQKRIESIIVFCKPTSLKEVQSFTGIVDYFKDHVRDHSAVAKPLYEIVALATKQKTKALYWTTDGSHSRN